MIDWRAVRRVVPEVLGVLGARRYGHFDASEDAPELAADELLERGVVADRVQVGVGFGGSAELP